MQQVDQPLAVECPRRNLQGILDSAEVKTACSSALPKPGLLKKPIAKAPKGSLDFKKLMST
jgi:hypothetical protein